MAFGNIGGNGNGRFPHLICETQAFPRREVFGRIVDRIGKIHRFLPGNQISEAQNLSHAQSSSQFQCRRYESLIPNPYALHQ